MADSSKIDVEGLFLSKTEKTFQYDNQLPRLPVPTLQHTLNRYLDSVKPHVSEEEYRQTEFIVKQFASGIGKQLHQQLVKKAETERNWLEAWWLNYAYLDYRLPIAPMINFSGPLSWFTHQYGVQAERAALTVHYYCQVWKNLRLERIKPDKDSKGQHLSMNQFRGLYNTCRIPAPQRDHIKGYFKTETEGNCPDTIAVLCNGRVFITRATDDKGEPLTPPELTQQFQYIKDQCDAQPHGPGIGALTGDNRTSWAHVRSHLCSLHPDNYRNLEQLQQCILVVVFDDAEPADETELFQLGLAGDSTNRWFDKSLSMIFFKNGLVASNCDHSPMDAMALVASTYFVDLNVLKEKGKWQGIQDIHDLEPPKELVFHIDDVIEWGISNAKVVYNKIAHNLQVSALHFTKYGKKFLRQFKLHPDTHVQMMLQYAYYKIHKKPASTYQTGTTRRFYNARTETVRSCTSEAMDWAKAMGDPNITAGSKVVMYKKAAAKHNQLMSEATENQGCDRHLFGLQILALEAGLPMPQLYTDPSYVKSGGGGNFTLSTSFVGYTSIYGGVVPMVEHGYGSFYRIEQNSISTFASAWNSCEATDAAKFNATVHKCLEEVGQLLEMNQAIARL